MISTPSTNTNRTWKFKLLIIAITVIVLFLVAEVGLRIKGDTYSWSENYGRGYVSPYEPYKCMDYWVLTQDHTYGEPEFDFSVKLNSLGLRDEEHTVEKDSGVFRIIGMGDSFTEGVGAPFDSTWLSQFGRLYQHPGYDSVEVISGGVRSSDPVFEYRLFLDKLLRYKPDMVLFVLNQTDVTEYFVRGGFERFAKDTCNYKKAPAVEAIFKCSHVVRSVMMNLLGYNWQLISESEQQQLWQAFVRDVTQIAADVNTMAKRDGFKLYFVFHPMMQEVKDGHYTYDFQHLQDDLRQHGVGVIDIYDTVSAETYQGDSLWRMYWPIDRHYNPYGYGVMAAYINERLSAEN